MSLDGTRDENEPMTSIAPLLRLLEIMEPLNQSDLESFNTSVDGDLGDGGTSDVQPLYAQVIIVLMYILIIIIAVGGNLLFSYVILMRPKMRSITNMFLLNLAISDIVKAVVCNPFAFMANLILLHWPYGDLMCQIVTYIQVCGEVFICVYLYVFICMRLSVCVYLYVFICMYSFERDYLYVFICT